VAEMKTLEADRKWRKSSYSMADGNCVQVSVSEGLLAVRDSKFPDRQLILTSAGWRAFATKMKK
jgi:Domain of unknown function (DUF397)